MKFIFFLIIIAIIYFIAIHIDVVHIDGLPKEQRDELNNRSKIRSILLSNYIKCPDEKKMEKFEQVQTKPCRDAATNQFNYEKFNFGAKINRYDLPIHVNPDIDNAVFNKSCNTYLPIENQGGYLVNLSESSPIGHLGQQDWGKDKDENKNYNYQAMPNVTNLVDIIKFEYSDPRYKFNLPNLPVTTRYPNSETTRLDEKYLRHIRNNINSWNKIFDLYCQNNGKIITILELKPIFIMETENEFV